MKRCTVVGTDSSSSPDVDQLLHRLRSTLARLKGQVELAGLDGHPFATEVAQSIEECLAILEQLEAPGRPPNDETTADRSVVIIDDDNRLASITARQLSAVGWLARVGEPVSERLPTAPRMIIDLGVLESLSEDQLGQLASTRFVVVTGSTDGRAHALARAKGALAVLIKPVDRDTLNSILRKV